MIHTLGVKLTSFIPEFDKVMLHCYNVRPGATVCVKGNTNSFNFTLKSLCSYYENTALFMNPYKALHRRIEETESMFKCCL